MTTLVDGSAALADRLFDVGAIQFGAFKLKLHETRPDVPLSPIFINLRTADHPFKPGRIDSETLAFIGEAFRDMIMEHGVAFTALAGIPRAGEPIADALAAAYTPPASVVRLGREGDENSRRITAADNRFTTGDRILLVEDVITRADTKLEAVRAVESAGGRIAGLVLLVDREQGGVQRVREAGYEVHALYTLIELVEYYAGTGRIEAQKAEETRAYLRDSNR